MNIINKCFLTIAIIASTITYASADIVLNSSFKLHNELIDETTTETLYVINENGRLTHVINAAYNIDLTILGMKPRGRYELSIVRSLGAGDGYHTNRSAIEPHGNTIVESIEKLLQSDTNIISTESKLLFNVSKYGYIWLYAPVDGLAYTVKFNSQSDSGIYTGIGTIGGTFSLPERWALLSKSYARTNGSNISNDIASINEGLASNLSAPSTIGGLGLSLLGAGGLLRSKRK